MLRSQSVQGLAHLITTCIVAALVSHGGLSHAIEIEPKSPVPEHSLVRVKYSPGAVVLVFGVRDNQIVQPDIFDAADEGILVFTGQPGTYLVGGSENGKRFQTVVEIGGVSPPDPVPPGPDPVPPDPDPLSPTATALRDAVRKLAPADRKIAPLLAAFYEAADSQLVAGVDQRQVFQEVRLKSEELLYADPALHKRWVGVIQEIQRWLKQYRERDSSSASIAACLRELAIGLRKGAS